MTDETARHDGLDRPMFRGCVFCYAGEWTHYGAKRAVRRVRGE